jgi:sodium/bile acid cotransporter 7
LTFVQSVLIALRREWFLTSLTVLIVSGLALGRCGYGPVVRPWADLFDPRITTAVVLFLMSVSLDSASLGRALRSPGPVVLAVVLGYGLLPGAAALLARVQLHPDLALGLLIAASVPSTLASASVMTRRAGGNDAVSLLATLVTNASCVVVTPAWLYATTGQAVEFDVPAMIRSLLFAALLPTALGQLARRIPLIRMTVDHRKPMISAMAQIFIEVIVFTASLRAGMAWLDLTQPVVASTAATQSAATITPLAILLVTVSAVGLHLGVWWAGLRISTGFGFVRDDAVAVSFSASQKTLPVGILVATDPATFGTTHPFAIFPMLIFHIGQLFLDSVLASRLRSKT